MPRSDSHTEEGGKTAAATTHNIDGGGFIASRRPQQQQRSSKQPFSVYPLFTPVPPSPLFPWHIKEIDERPGEGTRRRRRRRRSPETHFSLILRRRFKRKKIFPPTAREEDDARKKTRRRFPFFSQCRQQRADKYRSSFFPLPSRLAVKALLRSDRARMGKSLLKTSEFDRATGNAFLSLLLYFLTLTTQICVHWRFSYSGQYPAPRRRSNNKKHPPP